MQHLALWYTVTLARWGASWGTRCGQSSQALAAGLRGFCAFCVGSFTPSVRTQRDRIELSSSKWVLPLSRAVSRSLTKFRGNPPHRTISRVGNVPKPPFLSGTIVVSMTHAEQFALKFGHAISSATGLPPRYDLLLRT